MNYINGFLYNCDTTKNFDLMTIINIDRYKLLKYYYVMISHIPVICNFK